MVIPSVLFYIYDWTMTWLCDYAHSMTNVDPSTLFNCNNTTYEDDEIHGHIQYLNIV